MDTGSNETPHWIPRFSSRRYADRFTSVSTDECNWFVDLRYKLTRLCERILFNPCFWPRKLPEASWQCNEQNCFRLRKSRVFCQAIRVLHSSIGLNHFGPTLAWGARQWMVRCYLLTKLFGAARHCCLNYKSHGTIPVIGCCFWIHGEE